MGIVSKDSFSNVEVYFYKLLKDMMEITNIHLRLANDGKCE